MNINYFHIFRNKIILAEADEKEPVDQTPETDLDKILNKSTKVTSALVRLLSTQEKITDKSKQEIKDLVTDLRCISYKPTTFRVILTNGNYFDLKYDPTPNQFKYEEDYNPYDGFTVSILGKKYSISIRSEYEQALDGIQKIQREKAIIVKEPGEGETEAPAGVDAPPDDETPEDEPTET